jgi:hypothetical protein
MIPFSLLWGGFAVFWESSVVGLNAPPFFMLWGIPFVLVGLYVMVGRFFVDAWVRRRTCYALTGERVLIAIGVWRSGVQSLDLHTLTNLSMTGNKDGSGTISLGAVSGMIVNMGFSRMFASWGRVGSGSSNAMPPQLEMIADAGRVYQLIRDAQQHA